MLGTGRRGHGRVATNRAGARTTGRAGLLTKRDELAALGLGRTFQRRCDGLAGWLPTRWQDRARIAKLRAESNVCRRSGNSATCRLDSRVTSQS